MLYISKIKNKDEDYDNFQPELQISEKVHNLMDVKIALMTQEHVTKDGTVSSSFNKLNDINFASIDGYGMYIYILNLNILSRLQFIGNVNESRKEVVHN